MHSGFVFFSFSIEFDRDCDYFAIAGVTKKIKVIQPYILSIQFRTKSIFSCFVSRAQVVSILI